MKIQLKWLYIVFVGVVIATMSVKFMACTTAVVTSEAGSCDENLDCSALCIGSGQTCSAADSRASCTTNSDCASNSCNTETHLCSGSSVGSTCTQDGDCASGDCVAVESSGGTCSGSAQGMECPNDASCASGSCIDAVCIGEADACNSNSDCASNSCTGGNSVTMTCSGSAAGTSCTANASCGSGFCQITGGSCGTCISNSQCAAPSFCNQATHECVSCVACTDANNSAVDGVPQPNTTQCAEAITTEAPLYCVNGQCHTTAAASASIGEGVTTLCDAGTSCNTGGQCAADENAGCSVISSGQLIDSDQRCTDEERSICCSGECSNASCPE